jgi:predicted acylesterase/phospholipase RssA
MRCGTIKHLAHYLPNGHQIKAHLNRAKCASAMQEYSSPKNFTVYSGEFLCYKAYNRLKSGNVVGPDMKRIFALLIAGLFVSACSHTPPLTSANERCDLKPIPIEGPLYGGTRALGEQDRLLLPSKGKSLLFLSGGSQDGAFGAGFLDGWKANKTDPMPQFDLVTGISTGALQATGAFIQDTQLTVNGYTIDNETDLLERYVTGKAMANGLGAKGAFAAIKEGAFADLRPLRDWLKSRYTDSIYQQVHDARGDGERRLLVGATDFDLGQAVAFDLTKLATRIVRARGSEKDRLKNCYIEALIASSSVPLSSKPVFIDNRMYVDGGLRFAMFDDRLRKEVNTEVEAVTKRNNKLRETGRESTEAVPHLYAIFNGDGEHKTDCRKVNPSDCGTQIGQLKDWSLATLSFRTAQLMADQVARLSISRVEQRAKDLQANFSFARIRKEELSDKAFSIDDFEGTKTCTGWKDDDRNLDTPLEFHKRYMRCLIKYGQDRGSKLDWDYPKPVRG